MVGLSSVSVFFNNNFKPTELQFWILCGKINVSWNISDPELLSFFKEKCCSVRNCIVFSWI